MSRLLKQDTAVAGGSVPKQCDDPSKPMQVEYSDKGGDVSDCTGIKYVLSKRVDIDQDRVVH